MTIRHRGIERSCLVTTLDREVGVRVETIVIRIREVVLLCAVRNLRVVVVLDRLSIERRTELTACRADQRTLTIGVLLELIGIPLDVIAIGVCLIENVTSILTVTIFILEIRAFIDMIHTESL